MEGLISLGMKTDALKLARRYLRDSPINARLFNGALNAIMTLADKTKPWVKTVETAYDRLPKREQPAVRWLMMAFRSACRDHAGVLGLVPKRFTREFTLEELQCAMEAALELNDKKLMDKLVGHLPRYAKTPNAPLTQFQSSLCFAEYLARKGRWDDALVLLQDVQGNEILSQNAVYGIVELHVARALVVLRQGFELIEKFQQNFDPVAEMIVPGNDKAIQEDAARKFRRLQKTLEKIVPKERQRVLGLLGDK